MGTIAVIGGGYWGKNLIRVYHELGALKAICDTNPAVLEKATESYPDVPIISNYDEILGNSDIEGVVIALPAEMHYAFAEKALLAGKDVFVEKPLALNMDHAHLLYQLAREKNRILMVGHLLQYHPAFLKLRELVQSGSLGRLQYIYSNRLSLGKIRREENALWSFAPHDLSMILSLVGESPDRIRAEGANYLHKSVADVTITHLSFPSGVNGHVFVSWLHPFKEQKLVVVAEKKMAIFEDTQPWDNKIQVFAHSIRWEKGMPVPEKGTPECVAVPEQEPLRNECEHFLECMENRTAPRTDGEEGIQVLQVLKRAQECLEKGAGRRTHGGDKPYTAHPSAFVDEPCQIGEGTRIWHYSHIMSKAIVGKNCRIGQNVNIAGGCKIGNNVKIQNNVSVYSGVSIEDDVFLGPSCVFTNISNPRSQVNRQGLYERTEVRKGATIGANATIVCGIEIGRYAFVSAGAVVTKSVPDYAFMKGCPAKQSGWMSRHGIKLPKPDSEGVMACPESGYRYQEAKKGILRCLDLDEEAPLPEDKRKGSKPYRDFVES